MRRFSKEPLSTVVQQTITASVITDACRQTLQALLPTLAASSCPNNRSWHIAVTKMRRTLLQSADAQRPSLVVSDVGQNAPLIRLNPSRNHVASPASLLAVSRTLELSLQSSLQLSLTVLVRYRTRTHI